MDEVVAVHDIAQIGAMRTSVRAVVGAGRRGGRSAIPRQVDTKLWATLALAFGLPGARAAGLTGFCLDTLASDVRAALLLNPPFVKIQRWMVVLLHILSASAC